MIFEPYKRLFTVDELVSIVLYFALTQQGVFESWICLALSISMLDDDGNEQRLQQAVEILQQSGFITIEDNVIHLAWKEDPEANFAGV